MNTQSDRDQQRKRQARVRDLDARSPGTWSLEDALFHLEFSFESALRQHPDIMERFLPRLDGASDQDRIAIMRYALLSTVSERF